MPALSKDRPPRLGRYQLGRQVGEGTTWTLWTAKDGVGPTARDVLVKWVRPSIAENLEARLKLAYAARSVRELAHSGVARTLDLVEAARSLAIVLEPLEGMTLAALSEKARAKQLAMPIGVAVRVAIEALSALDALHGKLTEEARPSDLAPSSLLVTSSGGVKVLDFELDPVADTPELAARRAPERAAGGAVDPARADVYAVGVMLWECITGRVAFVGDAGTLGRVDADGVRKVDRCPTAVADVVARALSADPAARFESADEMGQELFAATRGAIAAPDDVAAFVTAVDEAPDSEQVGDRQTVRPPEPAVTAAPPNPFDRKPSPSGRPPPMQGRPAGKVKLTVPMGKSTPPPAPQKGATLVIPKPPAPTTQAAPAAPPAPPLPQRGATLKMNAMPAPPRADAPTPKGPAATSAPATPALETPPQPPPATPPPAPPVAATPPQPRDAPIVPTPAPIVPTPTVAAAAPPPPPPPPAPPPSPPPPPRDAPITEAPPTPAPVTQPMAAAPGPDPFYAPSEQSVSALPEVEPVPTAPAPEAAAPVARPLALDALPDEELVPRAAPATSRAKLIAVGIGGAVMLLVLLAAVSRKPAGSPNDPLAPPTSSEKPRAPHKPEEKPVEPSTKREWSEPTPAPSGPDDGPRGGDSRGGGVDPRATGAGGATPKASASEDKPPPPAPLRRKYNPKTI